jgi:hypothetical protein
MPSTPRRDTRARVALLCIALAAFAVQRAATVTWATAAAPSGERIRMTVVGLSRGPASSSGSGGVSCRWWPRIGDAALCAPREAGGGGITTVRRAYPLLVVGLWVAVLALFLQVLGLPRSAAARAIVTWAVAALTIGALATMLSAPRALAELAPLSVQFGGPGFILAIAAIVLSLASGWLALTSGVRRQSAG